MKVPAAVGVPITAPVEVFSISPAGSVPTIENMYGVVPPVTIIGPLLNATPTSPVLIVEQVTDRGPLMVIMQLVLEVTDALGNSSTSCMITINGPLSVTCS